MANAITILENLQSTNLDAGEVFSGTPSGHPVKGYSEPRLSGQLFGTDDQSVPIWENSSVSDLSQLV